LTVAASVLRRGGFASDSNRPAAGRAETRLDKIRPKTALWIDIWRPNGLEPAPSRVGMSGRRETPILPDPACHHGLPNNQDF
jgi:hypothetical protein